MMSQKKPERYTLKKLKEACDHHLTHHEFRIESLEMRLKVIEEYLERLLTVLDEREKQGDEIVH
jgi:hypothetical protein